MEKLMDFSVMDLEEAGMIQVDDNTGMPIVGAIQKPEPPTKDKDKGKEDEEKEDLIEINEDDPNKKKGEEPPASKEPETPSSDSVFKVLIEALTEKGVISSDINMEEVDKAIKEGEDPTNILFDIMNFELQSQIEFYKNNLPKKIQTLIEKYEEGVPLDEIIKVKSEQDKLDNIPESKIRDNKQLQEEIIKRYMTEKGETETRITKHLKRLEELDELEDDAVEAYAGLVEIYKKKEESLREKAIEANEKKEKERKEFLRSLETNINNTQEIISGISLTNKDKSALIESMTKPVGVDEFGNPISAVLKTRSINPIEFEKALHYYHHIGLFNFDKDGNFKPDFSKLSSDIKNKTVEKLSKILETGDTKGSGIVRKDKNEQKIDNNIEKISRFLNK